MNKIRLHNKEFIPFISEAKLKEAIETLAKQINKDYENRTPLFVGVLNGSFMFAADLMKAIDISCEISFVKMASYQGMQTSGRINELIGLNKSLKDRHIVIIEDIVDTGNTLEKLYSNIEAEKPASVETATLLFKPSAYKKNIPVKYVAIEIPNKFVVGYGLDYDGLGRNLKEIYIVKIKKSLKC